MTAFGQALVRLGWVEGKNIRIDYRFAAGDHDLFKTYAAELVGLAPSAILASTPPGVAAVRDQTHTIPIVFTLVSNPVRQGFVQSLARPGGNIAGFTVPEAPLMGKWLQLLKEAAPSVSRVAIMFNPDTAPYASLFNREIETAASSLGILVTIAPVRDGAGIDEAVSAEAREPGGGLICLPDSFVVAHRDSIVTAAARRRLPLIGLDLFPKAGGLMSYWIDMVDLYTKAALYIDRILRGVKPTDLPVEEPAKFQLIINMKAARALGLTVPQSLLARADEVIE